MSYWHSKIRALLGRPYIRAGHYDHKKKALIYNSYPTYYIYYGRQPICSVDVEGSSDATIRFGKWTTTLDRPPDVPYYSRDFTMSYIFKHLKGVERLDTIEERAKVFATKCKLLGGNSYTIVEVRNENSNYHPR